jgi:glycosyltransferase involved in cell wall biosynthesis
MLIINLPQFPYRGITAPYLWMFYKALSAFRKDTHYIIHNDYLNQPEKWTELKRWEVDENTQRNLGYQIPDTDFINNLNYSLMPDELFASILERVESNPLKAFELVLTKVVPELLLYYQIEIKKISKNCEIEAILSPINCPSLKEVAQLHGIPLIHFELGPLRGPTYVDLAYFDFEGLNEKSEFHKRMEAYKNTFNNEDLLDLATVRKKYLKGDYWLCDPSFRTTKFDIGVPLQIEDDTNLIASGNSFNNQALIAYSKLKFPGKVIAYKAHPGSIFDIKLKNYNLENYSGTDFLFECKSILTINSSIGFEGLLWGKRVFVLGHSAYASIASMEIEKERDRYLTFYLTNYLVPFELIFNHDYISFRIKNPTEQEIIKIHLSKINSIQSDEVLQFVEQQIQTSVKNADFRNGVFEQDTQIGSLNNTLVERNIIIDDLKNTLAESDSQITNLRNVIAEQYGQITNLNKALIERDGQINTINKSVSECDEKITVLNKLLIEKEIHINSQNSNFNLILNSHSWKITKPLRAILTAYLISKSLMLSGFNFLFIAFPRALKFYGWSPLKLSSIVRNVMKEEGIHGILKRSSILLNSYPANYNDKAISKNSGLQLYTLNVDDSAYSPLKVSVIVPNFNHEKFLNERLDSIYSQTYRNFEVILLDDKSSDNSLKILDLYYKKYPDITIKHYNDQNSGSVFNQWKKGLQIATGDLIWIAESDDSSSVNFLSELVIYFKNQAVLLAFARTEFVSSDSKQQVWTQEDYLADYGFIDWKKSFIKSSMSLVKGGWAIKNFIPNVSSAIFRKPKDLSLLNESYWLNMRMCGDWIFYLTITRGGLVAYTPNATNYYRQHTTNVSKNLHNSTDYYTEHQLVYSLINDLYGLDNTYNKLQEDTMYKYWSLHKAKPSLQEFKKIYPDVNIFKSSSNPKNKMVIAMNIFALTSGGGETFPINLANNLFSRGLNIIVINFNQQKTILGIRNMLHPSIPLLDIHRIDLIGHIYKDLGINVMHSHHAWVDSNLATYVNCIHKNAHIVTMHGMYEMMDDVQLNHLIPRLEASVDSFVYVAKKNLSKLSPDFISRNSFTHIKNALPVVKINKLSRSELGIALDDFVLCLVSRAIPEKGWNEAILSILGANKLSSRPIHLLLIGEGLESERLHNIYQGCKFVHFLGFKSNVRDYLSISDLGFIPSKFRGECAPLVLIECLQAGKPVLASNIGEIKEMLTIDDLVAGFVFELNDWKIDIDALAEFIFNISDNNFIYNKALNAVPFVAKQFDIEKMTDQYFEIYSSTAKKYLQ